MTLSDAQAERDAAQRRADIAETNLRLAVDDLTRERDAAQGSLDAARRVSARVVQERDAAEADAERLAGAGHHDAACWEVTSGGRESCDCSWGPALALHRERRPAEADVSSKP